MDRPCTQSHRKKQRKTEETRYFWSSFNGIGLGLPSFSEVPPEDERRSGGTIAPHAFAICYGDANILSNLISAMDKEWGCHYPSPPKKKHQKKKHHKKTTVMWENRQIGKVGAARSYQSRRAITTALPIKKREILFSLKKNEKNRSVRACTVTVEDGGWGWHNEKKKYKKYKKLGTIQRNESLCWPLIIPYDALIKRPTRGRHSSIDGIDVEKKTKPKPNDTRSVTETVRPCGATSGRIPHFRIASDTTRVVPL